MREPPGLADADIVAALRARYGLEVAALGFLPIGNDSDSAAYRVESADGARRFLKVRSRAGFGPASLIVPRALHECSVPHVVAPIPTTSGELWVPLEGHMLSLHPYIDARSAAETGLTPEQWLELGATVRRLHSFRPSPQLCAVLRSESYLPSRQRVIAGLLERLGARAPTSGPRRELESFIRDRRSRIREVLRRAGTLGEELRAAGMPFVLCHADLHVWNLLVDALGGIWIVDWDESVLAPKERDLMFVAGGIASGLVSERETERFFEGYGAPMIHPAALAYYRYAWAVQDMGAYAERILDARASEAVQTEALSGFLDLFAPGRIVEIAISSEGVS